MIGDAGWLGSLALLVHPAVNLFCCLAAGTRRAAYLLCCTVLLAGMMLGALAPQAQAVSATGGTVTNYTDAGGTNWTAHIFTNTAASTSLVFSVGGDVEVLVVGGGGGGGSAGGGAGGYVTTSMVVDATNYQVIIGSGGNGDVSSGTTKPGTGGDSVFGDIYAYGGGYGGVYGGPDNASRKGGDGGSGGGAGIHGSAAITEGAATNGQGYAGGTNGQYSPYPGGGGGGAASAGFTPDGGNGITNSISGVAVGYAGGGGGGWYNGHADSSANCGGGAGRSFTTNGAPGSPGTGGGGGGSGQGKGGDGGSGIVIIRYVIPEPARGTVILFR